MDTRAVDEMRDWEERPFGGGFAGLHDLAAAEFTGSVEAEGAWLFMLRGRVVGAFERGEEPGEPTVAVEIDRFEDATGTAREAPDPGLPLLFAMQATGGEDRGRYYTEDTPIEEVDAKLSEGGFTGVLELSENVLSGDYYVVYHGGRSRSVAFVGQSDRLFVDEEAYDRACDEVGIYTVTAVDLEILEIPEPEGGLDAAGAGAAAAGAGAAAGAAGATGAAGAADEDDDAVDAGTADTGPTDADADIEAGADTIDYAPSGDDGTDGTTDPSRASSAAAGTDTTDEPDIPNVGPDPTSGESRGPDSEESGGDTAAREAADGIEDTTTADDAAGATTDGDPETAADAGGGITTDSDQGATADSDPDGTADGDGEAAAASGIEIPEEIEADVATGSADTDGDTPGGGDDPDEGTDPREHDDGVGSAVEEAVAAVEADIGTDDADQPTTEPTAEDAGAAAEDADESEPPASAGNGTTAEGAADAGTDTGAAAGVAGGSATDGAADETTTDGTTADAAVPAEDYDALRGALAAREAEVERLETEIEELETELQSVRDERADLAARVEDMEARLQELGAGAASPESSMEPAAAMAGTSLFVRYRSKSGTTLDDLDTPADVERSSLKGNLRLERHTSFDAEAVAVEGRTFETFLEDRQEFAFVRWLMTELPFEIAETGAVDRTRALYEALGDIDRVEFDAEVDAGETGAETRTFDVVARDRMGDPLVLASLDDSRDPVTETELGTLVNDATDVAYGADSLAAAFTVTTAFFEPSALATADEATSGSLLSRDSRASFVKLSRKRGYHLCLVEDREESFYLSVPEL